MNRILGTSNGVLTGAPTYGYGLLGGNGAIVATGPDATNHVASVDTLAHELGHNLGLSHSNGLTGALAQYDTIYNLMNTSSRTVPVDTCQVTPYSCNPAKGATLAPKTSVAANAGANTLALTSASGVQKGMRLTGAGIAPNTTVLSISGSTVTLSSPLSAALPTASPLQFTTQTDVLQPFQLATIQSPPIFTELAKLSAEVTYLEGVLEATDFQGTTATALTSIKFRFSNQASVVLNAPKGAVIANTTIGSKSQSALTFNPPVTYAGNTYDFGDGRGPRSTVFL